ncbi:MAG: YcxB family protein [Lachnospiraceae bacterium]|nr:YcxB family protein [Lachnospiraceae bacterium]
MAEEKEIKEELQAEEIWEGAPELEFDVKMSSGVLYDYLLRHSYTSAVGLIGSCFGAFGIIVFFMRGGWLYLIMGVIVLLYLPLTLFKRSKMVMLTNPSFKQPLKYRFYDKGYTVSQDDAKSSVEWSGCTKAVSTKKSIIIYTGKNNASIFPRDQIPGGASELISLIAKYMEPKRVKIRF